MLKDEFTQCKLGDAFISEIVINSKSRDRIPALLIGLQHLLYVRTADISGLYTARCPGQSQQAHRNQTAGEAETKILFYG